MTPFSQPKTIVITGASSGLGAALAQAYAQPGVTLGLLGRNHERLDQVAALCLAKGAIVEIAGLNVMDKTAMHEFLFDFDSRYPIELCIANAGISAGTGGGGETLEQATRIFDVNLHGVLNTVHPVMDLMTPRRYGQIAIISSIAGFRGLPTAPAYTASKAAVRIYGQALRALLHGQGIGVSVICPGFIKTPMTDVNPFPMPFMLTAKKAAALIRENLSHNPAVMAFPWALKALSRLQSLLPEIWLFRLYASIPAKPAK